MRDAAAAAAEDAAAEPGGVVDGDVVVVPKRAQLPQTEVRGVGARLVRDALLKAAAANEEEGIVVDLVALGHDLREADTAANLNADLSSEEPGADPDEMAQEAMGRAEVEGVVEQRGAGMAAGSSAACRRQLGKPVADEEEPSSGAQRSANRVKASSKNRQKTSPMNAENRRSSA